MILTLLLSATALATPAAPTGLPPLDALAGYPALSAPRAEHLRDPAYVRTELPLHMASRFGVPSFFWAAPSTDPVTPRQAGASPAAAARAHLARFAPLYGLSAQALPELELLGVHDLGHGAVVVRFGARFRGERVFRDELSVVMDQELRAIALSGFVAPWPSSVPSAQISAAQAVSFAFASAGEKVPASALVATQPLKGEQAFALATQAGALELGSPVRVRPVYFHLPDALLPAFDVQLYFTDGPGQHQGYAVMVSAVDGKVLYRRSEVQRDAYSYRVWASDDVADGGGAPFDGPEGDDPTPNPTGELDHPIHPGFVAPSLLTLEHGPTLLEDPWLPAGATATVGNNCDAYVDLFRPDGYSPGAGDFRATTTSPGVFDRTYDLALAPNASRDQQMAATTQLFYDVNYFHDWYYGVGFTEAAGNAQTDNYGRGGRAGDELHAEAQDYSGTDNSNMYTPPDGQSPVMQMFVWSGAVDADLQVTAPSNLARNYASAGAEFAPASYTISGELVVASAANHLGCEPFSTSEAAQISGKILLVDRGDCSFAAKARTAADADALGLLVAQNTLEAPFAMVGDGRTTAAIPAQMISQADGAALRGVSGVELTLSQTTQVDRDGDLDNQIVAHEWGHYISNRLIHDGEGLNTNMSGGMGEGWADFHAVLLTVKEGDDAVAANVDWSGVYALTGFVASASDPDGAYYWGIRRVPYSTDMSKDPLTFADIQEGYPLAPNVPVSFGHSGFGNSEAHDTGEVWATMLWECYAALLRDTPGRLSFAEAQTRMREYLIEAYEATPFNPTFLEARDALLAVAYAQDPIDFGEFQRAFAKRGAGMHAISPDRYSGDNLGVTEDYSFGNDLALVSATLTDDRTSCDHDGVLDDGETGTLTVTLKNVGGAPLTHTRATVVASDPALDFESATVDVPATQPFGPEVTVQIPVSLSGASGITALDLAVSVTDPLLTVQQPVQMPFTTAANFDAVPNASATDDFESPAQVWDMFAQPGNIAGPDGSEHLDTFTTWKRIALSTTDHRMFGPDDDAPAEFFLVSPPLQGGAGHAVAYLRARWDLEVDRDTPEISYDGAVVEVSTDGDTWTDVGSHATVGADGSPLYGGTLYASSGNPLGGRAAIVGCNPSWPELDDVAIDLGDHAGQNFFLRFAMGSDAAAAAYGLELDDVQVRGIANTPFQAVVADRQICAANPPQAIATGPTTVRSGEQGQLDGSASTSSGGTLRYTWTQLFGPEVALDDAHAQKPTFTAPDVEAPVRAGFQLTVNDGSSNGIPAQVSFTVIPALQPTVANRFQPPPTAPDSGCGSTDTALAPLALLFALGAIRRRR